MSGPSWVALLIAGELRRRPWRRCTVAFVALFLLARPAAGQVVGDCNEDGCVQIGELIVAIKIVLGDTQLSACPAFADCLIAHDTGGIGCLTEAVDNALSCSPTTRTAH